MGAKRFTDLKVWQSAHQAVLSVYRWTAEFPANERYGMVTQMRRSAVSVAANIAEGFTRRTAKDRAHFYIVARSSAEELKYYLILARDLSYPRESSDLESTIESTCAMLYRLIETVLGGNIQWGGRS